MGIGAGNEELYAPQESNNPHETREKQGVSGTGDAHSDALSRESDIGRDWKGLPEQAQRAILAIIRDCLKESGQR